MSDFEVEPAAVAALARAIVEDRNAQTAEDAFAAGLVAAAWRALLAAGAIKAPPEIELEHAEVRLTSPTTVAVTLPHGGSVRTIGVDVSKLDTPGDLTEQLTTLGDRLAVALGNSRRQPRLDLPGAGQKPMN